MMKIIFFFFIINIIANEENISREFNSIDIIMAGILLYSSLDYFLLKTKYFKEIYRGDRDKLKIFKCESIENYNTYSDDKKKQLLEICGIYDEDQDDSNGERWLNAKYYLVSFEQYKKNFFEYYSKNKSVPLREFKNLVKSFDSTSNDELQLLVDNPWSKEFICLLMKNILTYIPIYYFLFNYLLVYKYKFMSYNFFIFNIVIVECATAILKILLSSSFVLKFSFLNLSQKYLSGIFWFVLIRYYFYNKRILN